MKRHVTTAVLYTLVSAVVLGLVYPAVVTVIAQLAFRDKANGQLISRDGEIIGSRIIGQTFTGARYFHSRPSMAGSGYDASASSGSNLGPTNKLLADRVRASIATEGVREAPPIDLVTASGSGLDPDISPAAALYQVDRIVRERHLSTESVRALVAKHTAPRQFGLLGEPTVNVLQLNLDLDSAAK